MMDLVRKYDLADKGRICHWYNRYLKYGCIPDERGKPQHNNLNSNKCDLISKGYYQRPTRGRRQIQMWLERQHGVHMCLGSVHRYMLALGLRSKRSHRKAVARKETQGPTHISKFAKTQVGTVLHSDQGSQYCSPVYHKFLKENCLVGSVSRWGNPYDNSPIESFFSTLKNEEIILHSNLSKLDMKKVVHNFIHFYNFPRPQYSLKKLTPYEYGNQFH